MRWKNSKFQPAVLHLNIGLLSHPTCHGMAASTLLDDIIFINSHVDSAKRHSYSRHGDDDGSLICETKENGLTIVTWHQ